MNVKAFAAIVGTLSLGALATGCASTKAAEGTTETQGAAASCGGDKAATGAQASCEANKAAAPTETKGEAGSCGAGSCDGTKKK